MDWLLFLVCFAVFYRAGEQHFTLGLCAWLSAIHSFAYMLASLAAGLVISRRNARGILLISTALLAISAAFCLYQRQFPQMMAAMAILGIFAAFFFNSFQAFMRGESLPGSLMKTVGLYTLSWSTGCSIGLISSGFLYTFGILMLISLSLAICLLIIIIIIRHERLPLENISSEEHIEEGPSGARRLNARYVWVGWVVIFTAMFVQRPVISFFPAISANSGLTPFLASLPLFLIYVLQAGSGLAMLRFRKLLYRRLPLAVTQISAAVLFLILWFFPVLPVCFVVFSMLGIYFGFAFFCSVYYSSNSGNRVLNVSINECLVGTAPLAGLFISEWWMRRFSDPAGMYAVCGIALFLSALAQFLAGSIRKPQESSDFFSCPFKSR